MKLTFNLNVYTLFDDGAGATARYNYLLVIGATPFDRVAATMWQLSTFTGMLPVTTTTWTAISRTVLGGAPPAAATRTMAVSSAGIATFVDADEELEKVLIQVTLSSVEDHLNDAPYLTIANVDSDWTSMTVEDGGGAVSPDANDGYEMIWSATGDFFKVTGAISAANIALSKIPLFSVAVGDKILLTRTYDGQYIEGGLKVALIALGSALSQSIEGIISTATNYLRGHPVLGVDIPVVSYSARMAVV